METLIWITSLWNSNRPTKKLFKLIFILQTTLLHFERPLLVVHKKIEKFIKEKLNFTNILIAHYENLSGLNNFEDCDAVILLGTPYLSDDILDQLSAILNIPREILEEVLVKGEMLQDVHRIREFIHYRPKTIIILSAYHIFPPETPVNYVSDTELIHQFGGFTQNEIQLRKRLLCSLKAVESMDISQEELIKQTSGKNDTKRRMLKTLADEGMVIADTRINKRKTFYRLSDTGQRYLLDNDDTIMENRSRFPCTSSHYLKSPCRYSFR